MLIMSIMSILSQKIIQNYRIMATKIFVNLPVRNLERSMAFFRQLGFGFNLQFTNEQGACMIINDDAFVMLLQEEFFRTFTRKDIADARRTTETLIAISADSRAAVHELVAAAITSGGARYSEPTDHGWMYQEAFEDLDGHQWEVVWMDVKAAAEAAAQPG